MWKKSLAMITMVGICGGMYGTSRPLQKQAPISQSDHDLSYWKDLKPLNKSGSIRIIEKDKAPYFSQGEYPKNAKPFGCLEPSSYAEVLSSKEKCEALLGESIAYMDLGDDGILDLVGPRSVVLNGKEWAEILVRTSKTTVEHPIMIDALVNAPHLIIKDDQNPCKKILFNAQEGKPFHIKGKLDFWSYDIDLIHSEVESFATNNPPQ